MCGCESKCDTVGCGCRAMRGGCVWDTVGEGVMMKCKSGGGIMVGVLQCSCFIFLYYIIPQYNKVILLCNDIVYLLAGIFLRRRHFRSWERRGRPGGKQSWRRSSYDCYAELLNLSPAQMCYNVSTSNNCL